MKTSRKWTTLLEGTIVVVLAIFLSVLAGCANPATGGGTSSSTVTNADAAAAAQTVVGGVSLIMGNEGTWAPATSGSVSYTSPYGISMSGSDTIGSPTSTLSLTITFNNYSDPATGYTVNGTGKFNATVENSSGAVDSGSITGSLTLSGGKVTSESWNVTNFTTTTGTNDPQDTFTGTVTCNGVSFDANKLSLGALDVAAAGATAVIDSVEAVMNDSGNWTETATTSTSGTVTYNPNPSTGVSISISNPGTYTTSGSDTTFNLPVTFNGYVDSTTGYTLTSGTLTVTVTVDTSTSPATLVSLSLSGGPIAFSGGPVTTQTFNNVQIGSAGAQSGTLSSNGTLFDARTL